MKSRILMSLCLLLVLTGCAGGWRGGVAPEGLAEAASTSAAAAAPAAKSDPNATHATADGAVFVYKGDGNSVNLAGEFNSWSTSADPLTKGSNGAWSLTKKLAPGKYAYKFVVNGSDWKPDPGNSEGVDDGFGGKNSLIVVGAGAAAAVATAPAAKPAAAAPAASGDGVAFRYSGPGNSVNLAGEFNSWSTSADPLTKQADGTWLIKKALAPGRYMYKFVIDGSNWKEDTGAKESADDGFGGKNSVVVVGGTAAAAPAAAAPKPAAAAPAASGDGVAFRYSGPGNSVNLAGEFNSWSTSADPLTKQADGTWLIKKALAPGRYMYKFVIDGSNWKEDAGAKESADDGFGGKNSVVVVGGTAAAAPPAAAPKPAAAAPAASGDGVAFRYSGPGNSVNLAGEFNSWSTSADPLTKQADGTWLIKKALAPGRYAYKFVIDGTNWKEDTGAKESVDDGYGGKNSIVVVGGGAGANAGASPAPAAAAKAPAAGLKPKAPLVSAAGVTFTFVGAAKSTVALCGDFNDWAANADPMQQQADGSWTITKKLAAGSHTYKFLVDGTTWKSDDGNPNSADDGFGGKNSLIVVK